MRPPAGKRRDVKPAPRHLTATRLALLHLAVTHLAPPPCTTQEIANDLFRFLRLEPWRVNTSHTSQTLKTGGAVMRDSIENADEVASVLKGTVFEGQVDEEFASWRATAAQ